jgi:AraC-like DNA-binding protein
MTNFPNVHDYDDPATPVAAKSRDYPAGNVSPRHRHPTAQLLYAVEGVMVVTTDFGQWVVPTTRGIWLPIGTWHQVRMVTAVRMRTIYVRDEINDGLPQTCCVLAVSPLLRELILAAMTIPMPYLDNSREGHIMRLLLDEVRTLPILPLSLPNPQSTDLCRLCKHLRRQPDDNTTVDDWAQRLHMDPRTLQRRFTRETGLSFGRWRRQARLLAALELLAQGRRVLDVALELGYESPTAFASMFRRELGVSPSTAFAEAGTQGAAAGLGALAPQQP